MDCDADGFVGGAEGASFLRRANLSNNVNREIWRLACGGKSQNKLSKDNWFIAMKLVGLSQQTGKCKLQPLLAGEGTAYVNAMRYTDTAVEPMIP